jgi:hypothetical protein
MAPSSRAGELASRCVVLALIAVITMPIGAATAAPKPAPHVATTGSIGIRLVDIPADTHGDNRALLYIVDHLAPGSTVNRRVQVSNTTDSAAHAALYSAAASIDHGAFVIAEGHTANGLSTWTSVDPGGVIVPAGGTAMATVRIAVPNDAPPGEQYAVVWAEVRSAPRGSDGVTQVNRVGIRIYLSVGRGNPPAEDFSIDSLTATRTADGLPMVLATVHNTGGRALDMSGTLELNDGPGGLRAGPFDASLGTTLAPGDTGSVTVILDAQLPPGPWDARIALESGLLERTERATITFPARGAVTVSTRDGGLLFALLGILALLLSAGVVSALIVRRRRSDRAPGAPGRRRLRGPPVTA